MFRKPEVFKFAKLEVVDYQPVLEGRMSKEEYQNLQTEKELEAIQNRTEEELKGTLKKPSLFDRIKYVINDNMGSKGDLRTIVDSICFEKSKHFIENNTLDIELIVSEIRQNKWLKETLLSRR